MDAPRRPSPTSFVWPPRPLPVEPPALIASDPDTPSPRPVGKPGLWLRRIEATWLDPLGGPLHQRRDATGWAPDAPDAYCDRCGHDVGVHEATEFGCARCRDQRLPWDRFIRLGAYESPLSDWVCEIKFNRALRLGLQLGALLGDRIRASLGEVPACPGGGPVVIPVPTQLIRRLARGLDHTFVLAQGVGTRLGASRSRGLLSRGRPSQRSLSPTERRSNLVGSMRLRRGARERLAGRLVILIDDVSTTGATLREASRALLAPFAGPEQRGSRPTLWVATAAVTSDRAPAVEEAGLGLP